MSEKEETKLFKDMRSKLSYLHNLRKFAEGAVGRKLKEEMETRTVQLQEYYIAKLTNAKDEETFGKYQKEIIDCRNKRAGILEAASFLDVAHIEKRLEEVEDALQEDGEQDEYATEI